MVLKYYPCAICGADAFSPLYKVKGFDIVQCTACTFVCVNPRIPNSSLYAMYAANYFNDGHDGYGYEDYELTAHLRIKTFNRWLQSIRPYLSHQKGPVLDIGCASGFFIDLLHQDHWDVEAIELDKHMVEKVRQKGFQVFDKPFEQFTSAKKYKLITMFDVLEHIPDLSTTFSKFEQLLDDDGIVVLITPDFDSRQRKIFGKRWFQFKPKEHIQYFSPRTLQWALERHHLEMVSCTSAGQYADTGFLLDRLHRYGFLRLHRFANLAINLLGLRNTYWYLDTGSLFAVIRKKK